MQSNRSLNKFGNIRDNQYREMVNDEFNNVRSQVVARLFNQTKQFLESYEREKVGDRLVNLEVAKTITAFNNAILKSTNDIDANKPNSEEGIIVAFRIVIDMLDAYINVTGTKPRDIERYKQMLYQSVQPLNTYYEKASQIDKIQFVNNKELEKISEIITRLESGYAIGQNYNGANIGASVNASSLDEEANTLYKDLKSNYQILERIHNSEPLPTYRPSQKSMFVDGKWTSQSDTSDVIGNILSESFYKDVKKVLDKVQPILDFTVSGKIDYKEVAKFFKIDLLPVGGRPKAEVKRNREELLIRIVETLRTYLLEVKTLINIASDPLNPVNMSVQRVDIPPAAPYTPPSAPSAPSGPSISPTDSDVVSKLKLRLHDIVREIRLNKVYLQEGTKNKAEKKKVEDLIAKLDREAEDIEGQLRRNGIQEADIQSVINSSNPPISGSMGSGFVAKTKQQKKKINNVRREVREYQKVFGEEKNINIIDLFPKYRKGVDFQLEGNGKNKSAHKKIILFDRI